MENFNIRDWQKKHLLKEEFEEPLDEFAINFKEKPELAFELIPEVDIDEAIHDLAVTFGDYLSRARKSPQGRHAAMQQYEKDAEEVIMKLITKAAWSAHDHILTIVNKE
jgi:hypothetical protein